MYEVLKIVHIAAVISWMAGLFYLPRLFVYHSGVEAGSQTSETFKVMERKLYRFICNPAMVVSVASGLAIAFTMMFYKDIWFHLKSMLVVGMIVYHVYLGRFLQAFADDANTHSGRFYRVINEVPTLLMLVIVTLVVVKPF